MGWQAFDIMERAVHDLFADDSEEYILPRGDFMNIPWKMDRRRLSSGTKGWQPPKRESGHAIIASRD